MFETRARAQLVGFTLQEAAPEFRALEHMAFLFLLILFFKVGFHDSRLQFQC